MEQLRCRSHVGYCFVRRKRGKIQSGRSTRLQAHLDPRSPPTRHFPISFDGSVAFEKNVYYTSTDESESSEDVAMETDSEETGEDSSSDDSELEEEEEEEDEEE